MGKRTYIHEQMLHQKVRNCYLAIDNLNKISLRFSNRKEVNLCKRIA
jgi:hypothetical protein